MAKKKKDDMPSWVVDEIQNARFGKPKRESRTGYILEIFESDNKLDIQLYEPMDDGRHIITVDLSKEIRISELERGVVHLFKLEQSKAPLSKRAVEYLRAEKEIEMDAIYQFKLDSLEVIDEGPGGGGGGGE